MNTWMSDAVRVSRRSRSIAARCSTPETLKRARRVGPLQGRRRRRHPVPHASRRRHAGVLHARLGPQRARRSTASGRTTTCNNMDRLARKFETARQLRAEAGWSTTAPAREIGIIGYGTSATGRSTRAAISCATRRGVETSYLRLRAYPFTDELGDVHRRARARLRRRAEPRRADAAADAARADAGRDQPSCAACCTTTACRSTRDRSPTTSWRRKA